MNFYSISKRRRIILPRPFILCCRNIALRQIHSRPAPSASELPHCAFPFVYIELRPSANLFSFYSGYRPGVPPRPFQSIASGVYISPGRPDFRRFARHHHRLGPQAVRRLRARQRQPQLPAFQRFAQAFQRLRPQGFGAQQLPAPVGSLPRGSPPRYPLAVPGLPAATGRRHTASSIPFGWQAPLSPSAAPRGPFFAGWRHTVPVPPGRRAGSLRPPR